MKKIIFAQVLALAMLAFIPRYSSAKVNKAMPDTLWIADTLYTTSAESAIPDTKGPVDSVYVFTNLQGQRAVAEADPGTIKQEGDRWLIVNLAFTPEGLKVHDANHDGKADFELNSWKMVKKHIGFGHLKVVGSGPEYVCTVARETKQK